MAAKVAHLRQTLNEDDPGLADLRSAVDRYLGRRLEGWPLQPLRGPRGGKARAAAARELETLCRDALDELRPFALHHDRALEQAKARALAGKLAWDAERLGLSPQRAELGEQAERAEQAALDAVAAALIEGGGTRAAPRLIATKVLVAAGVPRGEANNLLRSTV